MSKYEPLHFFLKMNKSNQLIIPFGEIEKILGFGLPNSAFKYNPW